MPAGQRQNRLAFEKSPYLLQHKNNPVDWFPWGEEAFARAKAEDRPVFLSIGYSTCHWCHVMEKESFEDEEIARILNGHYISIKVDREERPDIDHIYMAACQAMTGQGGWPLTVIMAPDKKPFFAGTYFPKRSRGGWPGLIEILEQVREKWETDRERIAQIGDKITEAVKSQNIPEAGELSADTLHLAFQQYRDRFDPVYGGLGSAPKFPAPHNLMFLLRYWKMTGAHEALSMVEKTLSAMHNGGIYDHIGSGFARYSTDREWLAPHFEKMLYDNALLAVAYLEACQVTGSKRYARVAKEIFTYVLRDMTSPEGGFYSAEDADSEGEEGKFYLWTPAEIKEILGGEEGDSYCRLFDITEEGNFEGRNIPNLIACCTAERAAMLRIDDAELTGLLELMEEPRRKLFAARKKRVHPHKDDKILTAWNGLMIAALAKGSRVLREPRYSRAAGKAAEFIWQRLRRRDGRLLARYREGEASYPAYLDDYAFLVWGLLELYEATFEIEYLSRAISLTEQMMDLFWDQENGGFFFYGEDGEKLIARPKELYDGVMPSGNSVAALNLLRLARLTGRSDFETLAGRQLKAFAGEVRRLPQAYACFLMALQFALGPAREVVIAGSKDDEGVKQMLSAVNEAFLPETVLVFYPEGEAGEKSTEIIPFLRGKHPVEGRATAYVCENYTCRAPITDVRQLLAALKK